MPIEIMAKRGVDALRFGPLKPVGLNHPITNERYHAVIQLRKEDIENKAFNLVGFQTNLIPREQARVFSLIPALKNAEYARFGAMHKNIFVNAPKILNKFSQCKNYPNVFIAGQLSGVEGYVESIASGLACGLNMSKYIKGEELIDFSNHTMLGALLNYITIENNNFQPMNSNFAIINTVDINEKDKKLKRLKIAERSLNKIKEIKEKHNV